MRIKLVDSFGQFVTQLFCYRLFRAVDTLNCLCYQTKKRYEFRYWCSVASPCRWVVRCWSFPYWILQYLCSVGHHSGLVSIWRPTVLVPTIERRRLVPLSLRSSLSMADNRSHQLEQSNPCTRLWFFCLVFWQLMCVWWLCNCNEKKEIKENTQKNRNSKMWWIKRERKIDCLCGKTPENWCQWLDLKKKQWDKYKRWMEKPYLVDSTSPGNWIFAGKIVGCDRRWAQIFSFPFRSLDNSASEDKMAKSPSMQKSK